MEQARKIDRKALVSRHRIELREASPDNVLTVGNGDFAYTADLTGMQTFTGYHDAGAALARAREAAASNTNAVAAMFAAPATVNTATMSSWGWHDMPNPDGFTLRDAMTEYNTPRGKVSYPDRYPITAVIGQVAEEFKPGAWLAENPQRIDLGRIGLRLLQPGSTTLETDPTRLDSPHQTLDPGRVESPASSAMPAKSSTYSRSMTLTPTLLLFVSRPLY
jgi:hypothetical protein